MVQIYSNIKRVAKEKGTSVKRVEELAELSCGSICKWDVVSPTARNLKKVADILDVTVDELLVPVSTES